MQTHSCTPPAPHTVLVRMQENLHFPEGVAIDDREPEGFEVKWQACHDRTEALQRAASAAEAQRAKERARAAKRDQARRNARKPARGVPKVYRCGVDGEYVNGIFLPYGGAYFKTKLQGVLDFACSN